MIKRLFCISILLCIALIGNAQDLIDSLKSEGYRSKPTEKSRFYNEIGIRYYRQQEFDSAIKYLELAAEFASQNDQFRLSGQAFNNAGAISDRQGDYKKAILNYQMALEAFKRTGNDTLIAQSQTNLGIAFKGMDIYDKALNNLYESAAILEKLGQKRALSSCYNAIGNILRELEIMDRSLEYLEKALLLRRSINYEKGVALSLHNIGIWNFENSNLNKAKILFNESLQIKKEVGDERSMASTLAKLGEVYMQQDSSELAEDYFKRSLFIREKFNDQAGIVTSSNHLARLLLKLGNSELAFKYLQISNEGARQNGLLIEQVIALEILKEYYHQQGDYQNALEISNELQSLNKLILDNEKTRSLMDAEIRYEVHLKDLEIASKQQKVSLLERRAKTLLVIALALCGIAILSALLLRASRKISKERKKGKEKVERLLKELNHRTKNHLQAQSGLIKQQLLKLNDQPSKDLVKDIDNQIKAINLIHQSLYEPTEESPGSVNLTRYVQNIVENLMISFGMTRNQINLNLDLEKVDIHVNKAMPVGLILNESVTNAFKHAFRDSNNKKLKVSLRWRDHETIQLKVSDNGNLKQPLESKQNKGGLHIMMELAEELSGSIEFRQDSGVTVTLVFPFKE